MASIVVCVFLGLTMMALMICWFIRDRKDYVERNRLLNKLRTIPLRNLPLIGQLLPFITSPRSALPMLNEFLIKIETPFVVWLSNMAVVHFAKLEDVEEVLKTYVSRNMHGLVEGTFGEGIAVHKYEKWKRTRRLMTPAFSIGMLAQYLRVFDEQGKTLVKVLESKAASGETFDLWPFLINANIDVISENMMGINSNCQQSRDSEYSKAFLKTMSVTVSRVLNPFLYFNFTFNIFLRLIGFREHLTLLHGYQRKAIGEARNRRIKSEIEGAERTSVMKADDDNVPKLMMIDLLLNDHVKNPNVMTEEQIRIELIHILAAGSESTAIGSGFLMLMLGLHQDTQEILHQEIISVIPDSRSPITMDNLNALKYLDQCIRETLRLFSVIPWSFREVDHPLTLPSGDVIPSDVIAVAHFKRVHLDPQFYPNPDQWNPSNFDTEALNGRPTNSFCAFGLGPRNCPGYKYAMLSMKVQVCHLLRNYRVYTDIKIEEIKIREDLMRRSAVGYPIKIRARKLG